MAKGNVASRPTSDTRATPSTTRTPHQPRSRPTSRTPASVKPSQHTTPKDTRREDQPSQRAGPAYASARASCSDESTVSGAGRVEGPPPGTGCHGTSTSARVTKQTVPTTATAAATVRTLGTGRVTAPVSQPVKSAGQIRQPPLPATRQASLGDAEALQRRLQGA